MQNERFQDTVVIEGLVRAAQRGVKIDVMARAPHTLKRGKLIEGIGGLRIMAVGPINVAEAAADPEQNT